MNLLNSTDSDNNFTMKQSSDAHSDLRHLVDGPKSSEQSCNKIVRLRRLQPNDHQFGYGYCIFENTTNAADANGYGNNAVCEQTRKYGKAVPARLERHMKYQEKRDLMKKHINPMPVPPPLSPTQLQIDKKIAEIRADVCNAIPQKAEQKFIEKMLAQQIQKGNNQLIYDKRKQMLRTQQQIINEKTEKLVNAVKKEMGINRSTTDNKKPISLYVSQNIFSKTIDNNITNNTNNNNCSSSGSSNSTTHNNNSNNSNITNLKNKLKRSSNSNIKSSKNNNSNNGKVNPNHIDNNSNINNNNKRDTEAFEIKKNHVVQTEKKLLPKTKKFVKKLFTKSTTKVTAAKVNKTSASTKSKTLANSNSISQKV